MTATYPSVALGGVSDRVPAFGDGDPLGVFGFISHAYREQAGLKMGMVVTYNPNTHSATVQIHGMQGLWTCVLADEPLSYSFGFSATFPAREGDLVLVYPLANDEQAGIIVGRIPYAWCFMVTGDIYNDPDQYHRRAYTQDELAKETWDKNISAYMAPLVHQFDDSSHIATHFRPTDVYPGEFALLNQHHCGVKGGLFSATLVGGGAQIRVSGLSNTARISCEEFKRFSMHASHHEFHNGRYLSSESHGSLYQEERLGWHSPEGGGCSSNVWTNDSEAPTQGENQTARPRLKNFTGFFGHLSSKFCLRPDPNDGKVRVQGDTPKDEGVSRETIDPSGQYRVSAAGMLTFERTGRIPVPVRICYPTDLNHDIPSPPEVLKPFEHKDDQDPAYRQLELFDRQAYDLKNQYARVDGLGFTPDHYVPQEEELKPLLDKYDPKYFNNETVKLTKYDKRRAGMYIGEDGSVIIRDAWGSEIVMLGGNVQISCAGNVMMLPGKTALTLAGDDIVQKAQNSVDIHASEHDVRLSAARNMEILGGGDTKQYSGGVVIESRGSGVTPWDGVGEGKHGESARLSGITLRTLNQAITVDGRQVNLRSSQQTRILSGDKDLSGSVTIAAKNFRTMSKTAVIAACKDESDGQAAKIAKTIESSLRDSEAAGFGGFDTDNISALLVTQKSVMATGDSVGLFAGKSLAATKGSKFPVPQMWVDVDNIADQIRDMLSEAMSDLSDEKTAAAGFGRENLAKMAFGFRTSDECGTNVNWTMGASGSFRLYEPAWVQVMKIYETLKNGGVDSKVYEENAEWENGYPWPGEEAINTAEYSMLEKTAPENLTAEGFNKSRKAVVESSDITEKLLVESYLVRK